MHDAAIVCGLMKILGRQAKAHGISRIRRVTVKVGKLKAVEPQALAACFEIFAEGTPAEGAELAIDHVPAHGKCRDCGRDFDLEGFRLLCPGCGGNRVDIAGGEDLYVESFET